MNDQGKSQDRNKLSSGKKKLGKKQIILGLIVLGGIGAMAMPVSNLVLKPDRPALPAERLADPIFAKAGSVMQGKCLNCHSIHTAKPWYFSMPVAKTMIAKDVDDGVAAFEMTEALFGPGDFSQVQLAQIEYTLNAKTMPPKRYLAMHWDARVSPAADKDLRAWISDVRKKRFASPNVSPEFAGEPIQPLPLKVEVDERKVALGDRLFHDTRLSADNTLSCASCHGLDKGGTDQEQFATGVNDQLGPINSPTVYNASYNHVQFWDGRAADLFEQADGPVTNPIEMASNWDQVIGKIKDDPYYTEMFAQLYDDGMTEKNIRDAIATFEETLITPNSAFDKYLMGDKQAVTDEQLRGYTTFVTTGCTSCHMGPALGGLDFQKMGKRGDYFAARGTEILEADLGRFNVTEKDEDRHFFKVPILRNIEVTYPYFHDGTVEKLSDAIDQMATYELDVQLSKPQIADIEAFLLALTGQYKGVPLTEIEPAG